MFGSAILDVAIGLALVFLLTSLLLTAIVEIIESMFKTRAADLEKAVRLLFREAKDVEAGATRAFYDHSLVFALFTGEYQKSTTILGRASARKLPSYIPRDIFSTVALDLYDAETAGPNITSAIDSFRRLYGDDVATLKANLENWYDGVMDRASGWYKRRTQIWLFFLGLLVAAALNINPIVIGQHLATTPEAREKIVAAAQGVLEARQAQTATPEGDSDLARSLAAKERALQNIDRVSRDVGLPMGWNDFARDRMFPEDISPFVAWLLILAGWLITAVAVTLGAPFWFDALNKLMVIRATVKPKEKSGDEASEDRAKAPAGTGPDGAPAAGRSITAGRNDGGDGCLDGCDLSGEPETEDIDLPPSRGGLARQ